MTKSKKVTKKEPKFDIDTVRKLYEMGCTDIEVAAFLEVCERTIYNWKKKEPDFLEACTYGHDRGNVSLKRAQFKSALDGNVTMLIWLGKNRLGQTDKNEKTIIEKTPPKIIREIVNAAKAENTEAAKNKDA